MREYFEKAKKKYLARQDHGKGKPAPPDATKSPATPAAFEANGQHKPSLTPEMPMDTSGAKEDTIESASNQMMEIDEGGEKVEEQSAATR